MSPIKTITSVLKSSADSITNSQACPIGRAEIIAIMSVSAFKIVVILYVSVACEFTGRARLSYALATN